MSALELLKDSHYAYYQFYSAMAVVVPFSFVSWILRRGVFDSLYIIYALCVIVATIVLALGAADAHKQYTNRATALFK
jgi:hypothetical protein